MTIDFVLGTRPELLKLIPVIRALEGRRPGLARILDTKQQPLLKESLYSEYALGHVARVQLEHRGPSLSTQLAAQIEQLGRCFASSRCAGVVVQGDTTSALAGTLAAFYAGLPVVHIEAGLRSHDPAEPFPEEMHRRMIACAVSRHFAPSLQARDHLLAEGVPSEAITVIGNPLHDLCQIQPGAIPGLDVIATMHRRENRPHGIRQLCTALSELARRFPQLQFALLDHSHPLVNATISEVFGEQRNLHRLSPLPHRQFLSALAASRLVMTDSGGVQEEAAMLARPTLVLRRRSDRPDGLESGTARCVEVNAVDIVSAASECLIRAPSAKGFSTQPHAIGEAAAELLIEQFQLRERELWLRSDELVMP